MRRIPPILAILGVILIILAGVWKLAAPPLLVKYPDDVDKTPHEVGTLTLYVDPATTAPVNTPQTLPVDVRAHLHVVSHTSGTVVVAVDQTQKIGPLPAAVARLQYVLNRRSFKNKDDNRAFAYQPTTVVDRSPHYSVVFPMDTGRGPYSMWKDETGAPFEAERLGDEKTKVNGTKLITMRGTQSNAPVQQYYIDTLAAQGIPSSLTLAQLTPQLRAQGVDPDLLQSAVLPRLTAADRSTVTDLLRPPIHLRYLMTSTTTWLVEPTSGVFTSLAVDESMSVRPDITAIGRIQTILAKPEYGHDPVVRTGADTLARLVAHPPTTKVLRIAYKQTPESVADITRYAKSLKDDRDTVETWIPLALLLAGLVLLIPSIVWMLLRRRRPRPAGPAPGGGDGGRGDGGGGSHPTGPTTEPTTGTEAPSPAPDPAPDREA